MADKLIYFKQNVIARPQNLELAGMPMFHNFFKIYSTGSMFLDRTGTIREPLRMKSILPMPPFSPLSKSYEDICNDRALELLARAEKMNLPIYVMWSGGIDSTLILVSLLKNATPAQRANIVVLMSEESISENPNFYRDHIHGTLRIEPSIMAPYLLFGTSNFVVNGEHNDQLFGSDIVAKLINKFGSVAINQKYNRDTLFGLYNSILNDDGGTHFILDLFERLRDAAPIPLVTNHDFLWWINFCLKWQLVHMTSLSFASPRNVGNITEAYLGTHYAPFFCTDDFQLWSMNNLDKRIKDTWKSYKWPCKDIIFDYTKDAEYRDNKIKRGSRVQLLLRQLPYTLIDDDMHFLRSNDLAPYHNPDNDFVVRP